MGSNGFMVPNPLVDMNAKAIQDITQQQRPQGQSPFAAAPVGGEQANQPNATMMNALRSIGAMHQARQMAADVTLNRYDNLTAKGFHIDGKAWMKALKQAGVKLDTTPEGIAAATNFFKGYQGEKDPMTGQQQQVPKEVQDMIGKAQTGSLGKKDVARFVTQAAIISEQRSARARGASELELQAHQQQANKALNTLLDDQSDPSARGAAFGKLQLLMPETYGKMDTQARIWQTGTAAEKQMLTGMALGKETEAQRNERFDRLTGQGIELGLSDTQSRARADAIINNKPDPTGMPEMTPQQMSIYAQGVQTAIAMGVPSNSIGSFATTYAMRGPSAAMEVLPAGSVPLEYQKNAMEHTRLAMQNREIGLREQELGLRKQEVGIEQTRANAEERRTKIQEAKEAFVEHNAGTKLEDEQLKTLVDNLSVLGRAEKEGIKIPSQVKNQFIQSVALASGMQPKQVDHLWGLWQTQEWVPGGVSVGDQGAPQAKPQGEDSPSTPQGQGQGNPFVDPGTKFLGDLFNKGLNAAPNPMYPK